MQIYLAGKVRRNCWRHSIVTGLRETCFAYDNQAYQESWYRWPVLSRAIFEYHAYTGPYFISCDHGCAHGDNSHGVAAEDVTRYGENIYLTEEELQQYREEHAIQRDTNGYYRMSELDGEKYYLDAQDEHAILHDEQGTYVLYRASTCMDDFGIRQSRVVELCFAAIRSSDLVFAWIESPDAYGTLVELGYAKAQGKQIWVAGPEYYSDLWFAYQMADKTHITYTSAKEALRYMLGRPGEYLVPPRANKGKCRSCGAAILWTKSEQGRNVPLDPSSIELREGQEFALTHFALCPDRTR